MDKSGCPFLSTVQDARICTTTTRRAHPTALQMTNYCTTEDHYRCPLILVKVLMGAGKLSSRVPKPANFA